MSNRGRPPTTYKRTSQYRKRATEHNLKILRQWRMANAEAPWLEGFRILGFSIRTGWKHVHLLRGQNIDAVEREVGPDPKRPEDITDPEVLPCLEDTPEGFRCFFNRYSKGMYRYDGLQEHSYRLVQAAYEASGDEPEVVRGVTPGALTIERYQASSGAGGEPSPRDSVYAESVAPASVSFQRRGHGLWKDQVVINVPRNHAKSEVFSVWFPAWRFCLDRDEVILLLSHTEALARQFTESIQRLLTSEAIVSDFGRFKPDEGTWAKQELVIAGRKPRTGPSLFARGVKQQIRGLRATWLIADDAIADEDANSDVERRRTFEWFTNAALPAVDPDNGHTLVIGTRLHIEDLFGKLVMRRWLDPDEDEDQPLWEHVVFPALRNPVTGEPSVEATAEALWPARWPARKLLKMRANDEAGFDREYQQDPATPEDLWFDYETLLGVRDFDLDIGQTPWKREDREAVRVVSWDPGAKGYGVAMVMDVKRPSQFYQVCVLDIVRRRGLGPREMHTQLEYWQNEYGPLNYFIPEKNMYQWIQSDPMWYWCRDQGIIPKKIDTVAQNKFSGELGWQSLANDFAARRIKFPYASRRAQYMTDTFIAEARYMPHSSHDDQIAALWLPKPVMRELYIVAQALTAKGSWNLPERLQRRDNDGVLKPRRTWSR